MSLLTSGRGYAVQIHNPSQKHFVVKVELENPTLDQRQEKIAQLAPGEIVQIDTAQGWSFFTGETIRLLHEGYRAKELTIP